MKRVEFSFVYFIDVSDDDQAIELASQALGEWLLQGNVPEEGVNVEITDVEDNENG